MPVSSYRVVIVEDDHAIAEDVRMLLEARPEFIYLGTAANVSEASLLISSCKPDVVVSDIMLGHQTAFELLEQLIPLKFRVIFLTSHPHYAIKAVKLGAADYLLKPLDEDEFFQALDRVQQRPSQPSQELMVDHQPVLNPSLTGRLAVRSQGAVEIIPLDHILYLKSAGHTSIHLVDNREVVSSKLIGELEELLPSHLFVRVHQSILVNIAHVRTYYPEGSLLLSNQETIAVAERKRSRLMSFLTGNY